MGGGCSRASRPIDQASASQDPYESPLGTGTERLGSLPDAVGQRGTQQQTPVQAHYSALRFYSSRVSPQRRGQRTDSSANVTRMAAHRAQIDAKLQLYDERQSNGAPWAIARLSLQGPTANEDSAEADDDAVVARLRSLQSADVVRLRAAWTIARARYVMNGWVNRMMRTDMSKIWRQWVQFSEYVTQQRKLKSMDDDARSMALVLTRAAAPGLSTL